MSILRSSDILNVNEYVSECLGFSGIVMLSVVISRAQLGSYV